jgi:hypothetical protein
VKPKIADAAQEDDAQKQEENKDEEGQEKLEPIQQVILQNVTN